MTPVIALEEARVVYGTVCALDGVTLTVEPGEVLGIVGDNGAGKSTLLKVITGFATLTSGKLQIDGRVITAWDPRKARESGIEIVYQDLALVEDLSLWRNFFLGKELKRRIGPFQVLAKSKMRNICAENLNEIGLTRVASVDVRAGLLSGGERQALAITRAMHFGARALLLDEPTAALAVRETQRVFHAIAEAKSRNLGIVYVDHNMAHVHPIADRIAVIRHGKVAAVLRREEVTLAELLELVSARTERVVVTVEQEI